MSPCLGFSPCLAQKTFWFPGRSCLAAFSSTGSLNKLELGLLPIQHRLCGRSEATEE